MAKNLEVSFLLDFYGEMLTEKQREAVELYYFEDLSLAEIADNQGISRQGVRDAIKRSETLLFEMEDRLGLAKKFREIQEGLQAIAQAAQAIDHYNDRYGYSSELHGQVAVIQNVVRKLCDG